MATSNKSTHSSKTEEAPEKENKDLRKDASMIRLLAELTGTAIKIATKTGEASMKVGKAFLPPERASMMQEAGSYLRDLREVAGLTVKELGEAMDLADDSILTAVENGTATLSFELILRLAAVLARHDPLPFVLKFTRTYNPEVWKVFEVWGMDRLPIQLERERQFINIYRQHDAARKLSEDGFQHVLQFTQAAFEMALHFVAETENINEEKEDKTEKE